MFGTIVTETCEECGEVQKIHYGCTCIFKDENGVFYYDGCSVCCKCNHLINSIRVKEAEKIGAACF